MNCWYCHNHDLISETKGVIDENYVLNLLEERKKFLDGVVITGGEPTLQPDLADFLKKIKDLGYAVKLDTNGSFPEKLKGIIELGLADYVAMDIKNCKEKYAETIGLKNYDITPVEESMKILKNSGVDYEFRTTVTENFHTNEDIEKLAEWIKGTPKYFLQNFVDSGMLIDGSCKGVSRPQMREMLEIVKKYVPNAELRGI
jgi:pyruvate formate lyase activating enzyme